MAVPTISTKKYSIQNIVKSLKKKEIDTTQLLSSAIS